MSQNSIEKAVYLYNTAIVYVNTIHNVDAELNISVKLLHLMLYLYIMGSIFIKWIGKSDKKSCDQYIDAHDLDQLTMIENKFYNFHW